MINTFNKLVLNSSPLRFWGAIFCFIFSVFSLNSLASFSQSNSLQIEINLIARKLELKENGQLIKAYPIGVAKSKDFITPPGLYKIEVKDKNPGWINPFNPKVIIPPGKNNPLGTRWIGFHGKAGAEYGIHGTNKPDSIGKTVSHGCIRMLISDSEDLFERVEIGTPILVYYERFEIIDRDGDLILTIKEDPYNLEPLTIDNLEKQILKKYPKAIINRNSIAFLINEKNPINLTRFIGYLEPEAKKIEIQEKQIQLEKEKIEVQQKEIQLESENEYEFEYQY